jgi:hypothetical protein
MNGLAVKGMSKPSGIGRTIAEKKEYLSFLPIGFLLILEMYVTLCAGGKVGLSEQTSGIACTYTSHNQTQCISSLSFFLLFSVKEFHALF